MKSGSPRPRTDFVDGFEVEVAARDGSSFGTAATQIILVMCTFETRWPIGKFHRFDRQLSRQMVHISPHGICFCVFNCSFSACLDDMALTLSFGETNMPRL